MRRQHYNYDAMLGEPVAVHKPVCNLDFVHVNQFGIIPSDLVAKLSEDSDDFRARSRAIDELKVVVKDAPNIDLVVPHLHELLEFIRRLLEDANFKVNTVALEIISILVDRLPARVLRTNVSKLLSILGQRLGDSNSFTRESIVRTMTRLMKITSPSSVLNVLCDAGLVHRNARVRQETVNIVIIALLTFPSYDFDLQQLARTVSVGLIDPRRPVRQAALECFAVLAQAMGGAQRSQLMSIVDELAAVDGNSELTAAVEARLTNRQLPKQDASGLVEYATYLSRGLAGSPGADIAWILSASAGHSSSAKSTSSDGFPSARTSASSSPALRDSPLFGNSRLRRSARKGLSRLPWDNELKTSSGRENDTQWCSDSARGLPVGSAKKKKVPTATLR